MKRLLLLLLSLTLLFSLTTSAWAGENTFYYLGGSGLFEYERSITTDTSLSIGGTALAFYFNQANQYNQYQYNDKAGFSFLQLSVGFRKYFDDTEPQNGFYLGGYGSTAALKVTSQSNYSDQFEREEAKISGFGGGIMAGNKFNSQNGFTFDIGIGLAAIFVDADPETTKNFDLNAFYILPIGRMAFGYSW